MKHKFVHKSWHSLLMLNNNSSIVAIIYILYTTLFTEQFNITITFSC